MELEAKVGVKIGGRAQVKSKNQLGRAVLAPLMLKWSKINTVKVWTIKTSSNTSPDTHQYQKPPFEPFTSV